MVGTLYKRATRAATVVFAVLHGDQHRLVYRAIDLWLAYQIAWLALGLRHRRDRDAGGADHFPCLCRTVDEAL